MPVIVPAGFVPKTTYTYVAVTGVTYKIERHYSEDCWVAHPQSDGYVYIKAPTLRMIKEQADNGVNVYAPNIMTGAAPSNGW